MSSSIVNNNIKLTRGDTFVVKVVMKKDGAEYTPEPGDVVRFAVKHDELKPDGSDYVDDEPLILKEVPIETMLLQLDPEDTKKHAFGTYVYDMEITFADGAVDTFIKKKKFKLTEEVH